MGCFVVAEFLLTSASRGPSAIAEPIVIVANADKLIPGDGVKAQKSSIGKLRPTMVVYVTLATNSMLLYKFDSVAEHSHISNYLKFKQHKSLKCLKLDR